MDAYSIEKVLDKAKETVKDIDMKRVDHQAKVIWTMYHMLETLLQDAADNAAARARAEHHANTST